MQDKIYCPKCKKYVPYHIKKIIREGSIEGYGYKYLGETSICDKCGAKTYTSNNVRKNIDKSYEAYYRRIKEEETQKKNKKERNKLIAKVVSGVVLLTTVVVIIRRKKNEIK